MLFRTGSLRVFSLAAALVLMAGCCDDSVTGVSTDRQAPTVISTNPVNGGVGAAVITATFSEPMSAATLTGTTFKLTGPGATPVAGTVSYDAAADRARFSPTSALALNTLYTATITTGAKDVAGNALASNYVWTFTTAASNTSQLAVPLGTTSTFAVLGGSTVTSTGATALTGDMGVSPGTAITGFPPGTLTGATHAGDATAATAMNDLTTAYNNAAGRTVGAVTIAGNLGGLTLTPGLYKSTSSLAISSGDLTLDAQGNPNAVFIFQMASTLTTTSGRAVILAGGAKSANIFWQVGTSATLGTSSVFKGTLLANQSITMTNGASLNGRALTRIGAVTMAANAVVLPSP